MRNKIKIMKIKRYKNEDENVQPYLFHQFLIIMITLRSSGGYHAIYDTNYSVSKVGLDFHFTLDRRSHRSDTEDQKEIISSVVGD